jgi:hypothetical protein
VISGCLALALDENWDIVRILSVPGLERRENLETIRGRRHINLHAGTVAWWSLICVFARVESIGWKSGANWGFELKLFAILVFERVGQRIEVERSSNGQRQDEIRRRDECVSRRVGVVSSSKVAVIRRDNCIGLALFDVATIPCKVLAEL